MQPDAWTRGRRVFERLGARIRWLCDETRPVSLAVCHPQTPWYAKLVAAAIIAYVVSPIDLIPGFIPLLGYVDDLILVPLGILPAIRLIPAEVMAESRRAARVGSGYSDVRPGMPRKEDEGDS